MSKVATEVLAATRDGLFVRDGAAVRVEDCDVVFCSFEMLRDELRLQVQYWPCGRHASDNISVMCCHVCWAALFPTVAETAWPSPVAHLRCYFWKACDYFWDAFSRIVMRLFPYLGRLEKRAANHRLLLRHFLHPSRPIMPSAAISTHQLLKD